MRIRIRMKCPNLTNRAIGLEKNPLLTFDSLGKLSNNSINNQHHRNKINNKGIEQINITEETIPRVFFRRHYKFNGQRNSAGRRVFIRRNSEKLVKFSKVLILSNKPSNILINLFLASRLLLYVEFH